MTVFNAGDIPYETHKAIDDGIVKRYGSCRLYGIGGDTNNNGLLEVWKEDEEVVAEMHPETYELTWRISDAPDQ